MRQKSTGNNLRRGPSLGPPDLQAIGLNGLHPRNVGDFNLDAKLAFGDLYSFYLQICSTDMRRKERGPVFRSAKC
jgi:hypothetical protein